MSKEGDHSDDIGIETQNKLKSLSCGQDSDDGHTMESSAGSEYTEAHVRQSSKQFNSDLALNLAATLAARGRAPEALESLEPYLRNNPNDKEALCLRANCLASIGSKAQALASFAGALALDPQHVHSLVGCAALHKDSGLLEESLEYLRRAQACIVNQDKEMSEKINPLRSRIDEALAIIYTDLGTRFKQSGKQDWQHYYEQALSVCPLYPAAHYNLGVAASENGHQDKALEYYKRAVELESRYPEAWCNMGVIYKSQGCLEDAINSYERALAAAPNIDTIKTNLVMALTEYGTVLKEKGNREAGIVLYERALALQPKHAEALYNLGVAYAEKGDVDKAIFMYEMTISSAPQCAEAHNNLGVLYRERGNIERAIQCYEAALSARPTFPQGLNNLAVIYTQQGKAHDALNMLRAALLSQPTYAEAYNNLGVLQRDIGDVPSAIQSYERCSELDPDNRNAGQNRLLALNYVHHGETSLVCDAHAEWGRRFQELHPRLDTAEIRSTHHADAIDRRRKRGDPLIVGYLTPDLFVHSVSYFAEAPLCHHDSRRVRCIVYNACPRPDAKTERLRAAVIANGGLWKDVASMQESDLALLIRDDGVDILVELTGHTAHNRLGVMARKPAPVQATWIGYPNSTGLESIDYRFTDALCDPINTTQSFVEELVRLPGCFLCYTPPASEAPPVSPLPALNNGFITFGSFNALAKQTTEVLNVWAHLLQVIPQSRLVLKNKPFACETLRQQFWSIFEEQGISRDRIDLLPLAPTTLGHLAQYAYMDICLDPWPYAGTTTTAEALYMGVPCLTLRGACHAHNVGASLLTAVGLNKEWVADSIDDYIYKARKHSEHVESLSILRSNLREKMVSSRLCDAKTFVCDLEDVYYDLWNRYLNSGDVCGSDGCSGGGSENNDSSGSDGSGSSNDSSSSDLG